VHTELQLANLKGREHLGDQGLEGRYQDWS